MGDSDSFLHTVFRPLEDEHAVLRAFAALKLGLEQLARHRERPPHDARGWERLFTSSLGWLDYVLAVVPDRAQAVGMALESVVPWDGYVAEARALAALLEDRFAQFTAGTGHQGPDLGQLLDGREEPGAELWLWADCMRWDLLNYLLSRWTDPGGAWDLVGGGFAWASQPTVTRTQVEAVTLVLGKAPDFQPVDPRGPFLAAPAFHRTDLVDDKVHTCKDDYVTFLDECRLSWRRKVEPFLEVAAGEGLRRVLILSDHGYRINQSFRPQLKLEQPRYLHGEGTPGEVLCPWIEIRTQPWG